MGPLLCSCVEACEPIELLFGVVNGWTQALMSTWLKERSGFWGCLPTLAQWFQWPNFQEKCIRLMREKLRIFAYAQHILESTFHWLSNNVLKFEVTVEVYE